MRSYCQHAPFLQLLDVLDGLNDPHGSADGGVHSLDPDPELGGIYVDFGGEG